MARAGEGFRIMQHPPASLARPLPGDDTANLTSMTLLERVKGRDDEAWRRLVGLYTPLLRHWCRRWGLTGDDADDVLQDVFQAVSDSLAGFRRDREGDSFRNWLHGVARHKALSFFRRRGARGPGGTDFYRRSLLVPDPGQGPTPDEEEGQLVGALYKDALRLVRGEFEERTWQAFWRAAVEGQPPAVIAADLGVTPAAVRQSKSRVLRRLKEVLGEAQCPSAYPG
jgi:RNA polymerase sigma-70 factor (ECF subfamily)